MSEPVWEPLAEVYISHPKSDNKEDYTFCLCTRVLTRNSNDYGSYHTGASGKDDLAELEDSFNEKECDLAKKYSVVKEEDGDVTSCYYSASASHTDHYYSTDEHDAHNMNHQGKGLPSSDSGADISDTYAKIKENEFVLPNSLPKSFGSVSLQENWEKFWSINGERLIWASWIGKYSDYMNEDQKDNAIIKQQSFDSEPKSLIGCQFAYDDKIIDDINNKDKISLTNPGMEIIISACSPSANTKEAPQAQSNPIFSNLRKPDYDDTLLSPRCDSATSSIPLTVGTSDSMTNVTRMTITSIYESSSSRVSTDTENSLSGSVCSNYTSSNEDNEAIGNSDLIDMESRLCLIDEDQDGQCTEQSVNWQLLWHQHFQEQYSKHYKDYMKENRMLSEINENSHYGASLDTKYHDNLFHLAKLQLTTNINETDFIDSTKQMSVPIEEPSYIEEIDDEAAMMAAMGLPTAFGSTQNKKNMKSKLMVKKKSQDIEFGESNVDRIRAAFTLMGFAFDEKLSNKKDNRPQVFGEVVYRKKHIRLHNRILKLKQTKRFPSMSFNEESDDTIMDSVVVKESSTVFHSSSDDDSHKILPTFRKMTNSQLVNNLDENKDAFTTNFDEFGEIEEQSDILLEQPADEFGDKLSVSPSNRKEKKKRRRTQKLLAAGVPPEIVNDKILLKYWYKRFSLFSLFDNGIKLDIESWFSVTPEQVAMHIAKKCSCDIILDAFCGAGGNAIQFASACNKVIAIDVDPNKIEMAQHNAKVYGVEDRIEFIIGDSLELMKSIKADVVFLSPPWGGPTYLQTDTYDLEKSLLPTSASILLTLAKQISNKVVLFLPRNANTYQIATLAGAGGYVEIEQNFLDRKLIALTAYYGNFTNNES